MKPRLPVIHTITELLQVNQRLVCLEYEPPYHPFEYVPNPEGVDTVLMVCIAGARLASSVLPPFYVAYAYPKQNKQEGGNGNE